MHNDNTLERLQVIARQIAAQLYIYPRKKDLANSEFIHLLLNKLDKLAILSTKHTLVC